MRRLSSTVLGSRLAVAITTAIVTTVVVAGGIAVASVPNNSVGTGKIIDNSIRSRDIRNGAVRSIDIGNGVVTGADIRNGSVQPGDLAPAARAGPAIADYNDAIQLVQSTVNPTSGNLFSRTATCPAGKRAVAGGGSLAAFNTFIAGSGPETGGPNPQGWSVVWKTTNNATVDPPSLTVWALCMPVTGP